METINAGHIAPAGYTRPCVTMEPRGCKVHPAYTIGCPRCDYVEVRTPITLTPTPLPGTESDDDILALILDESGNVAEWITRDTDSETAQTIATWGTLVISADAWDTMPPNIAAAMHEATLSADCFGLTLDTLAPSL